MPEPLSLGFSPGLTHARRARLHSTIWPLVDALRTVARPLAARRPAEPVSPAVLADAKTLFAATRRVLSREPGMGNLFVLGDRADWATLLTQLEFAWVGLTAFRQRYAGFDRELGELVWHDEYWDSFRFGAGKSGNAGNDLGEN